MRRKGISGRHPMKLDEQAFRDWNRRLAIAVGGTADRRARAVIAVYAALAAIALSPVFLVDIIPIAGFANHIARVHVLAEYANDPLLRQAYSVDWAVKPNLGLDIVLPPLARILPLFVVGKIFFAAALLLLAGGTVALHRALHGRTDSLWPAAAFLLLYNQIVMMGFLNYAFGLGLALLGMAGWIVMRGRPTALRITVFSVFATVLFFTHLMSLGIYGLVVGAHEFSRALGPGFNWRRAVREWAIGAAQFVLPAVLLVLTLPPHPEVDFQQYGGLLVKIFAILSPFVAYRDTISAAVILLVVVTGLFGLVTKRFRLAPDTALPLVALAVVGLSVPFTTHGRYGGVWGLDLRIFVALAFFAVAAVDFQARCGRVGAVLGLCALAVFGGRVGDIGKAWRVYDAQFAEYRAAATVIEPGSVIMQAGNVFEPAAGDPAQFPYTYWYIATLSVIDRSVFVPTFYTDSTKQPVIAAERYKAIDTPVGQPVAADRLRALTDPTLFDFFEDDKRAIGERMYGYMWQDSFQYMVVVHSGESRNPVPELLDPVAHGSFFDIYRIRQGGCLADYPRGCAALRKSRAEGG